MLCVRVYGLERNRAKICDLVKINNNKCHLQKRNVYDIHNLTHMLLNFRNNKIFDRYDFTKKIRKFYLLTWNLGKLLLVKLWGLNK